MYVKYIKGFTSVLKWKCTCIIGSDALTVVLTIVLVTDAIRCKIVVGENFGEFGKLNVIHQYFTQPNFSPFLESSQLPDKILHVHE